jgi:hypothetical protein
MCHQVIVLANGTRLGGRLVEHQGGGRAIVDVDGKRYSGRKAELVRSEVRR